MFLLMTLALRSWLDLQIYKNVDFLLCFAFGNQLRGQEWSEGFASDNPSTWASHQQTDSDCKF